MRGIITADWHLRETMPRCLVNDDWIAIQKSCLVQVTDYAVEKDCPVFVVGDMFHSVNDTSMRLVSMVQDMARELDAHDLSLYIIAGNHDLPYHSMANFNNSAVRILLNTNNIYPIAEYNAKLVSAPNFSEEVQNKKYVFRHVLTFASKEEVPPNVEARCAADLCKETPDADYIFTGDMHKHFVVYCGGQTVINPGCLNRQAFDFLNYDPLVYYVDTKKGTVEGLPIDDGCKFADVVEVSEAENYDEFIEALAAKDKVSIDFVSNVRKALAASKSAKQMRKMISNIFADCGVEL